MNISASSSLEYYELKQRIEKEITHPPLKVLHIWNTAGVGVLPAKYMDRYYPTDSHCIMRKALDKFKIMNKEEVWDFSQEGFIKTLLLSRKFDVQHIHDLDCIISYFESIYLSKSIILHYGINSRCKWPQKRRFWKKANQILVSTPDLLKGATPETIYIPNPIVFEFIEATSNQDKILKAFHVGRYASALAQEYAKEYGLEIEIFDKEATPLPHNEFHRLLRKFEYNMDVKRELLVETQVLEALSLKGLEALVSGAMVINWRNDLLKGLPHRHDCKMIIKDLWEVYKGCY